MYEVSKDYTKLEAAREQIESAIRLLFDGELTVSTHTLCSAAFNILRDLSKKKDGDFAFEVEVRIKPEFVNLFWNKHANFSKHADKDPDEVLKFNDMATAVKLMLCCWGYKDLTGSRTPIMEAFCSWMLALYPHLFKLSEAEKISVEQAKVHLRDEDLTVDKKRLLGRMLVAQKLGKDPRAIALQMENKYE